MSRSNNPEGDPFEVPATAILRLKPKGVGHGRSANLHHAREQAVADAKTWVLREFDSSDSLKSEEAFSDDGALRDELSRRGLDAKQQDSLLRDLEIAI